MYFPALAQILCINVKKPIASDKHELLSAISDRHLAMTDWCYLGTKNNIIKIEYLHSTQFHHSV